LLQWLDDADFYYAPASTRYHGAYEGGLCQHSLDVLRYARITAKAFGLKLDDEHLAVAALFHDLCKVNFYHREWRSRKNGSSYEQVPIYTIEEQFVYGGHGSKSVYVTERHMRLEPDEAVAINCHMGAFPGGDAARDVTGAYQEWPLAWVIHVADEAAAYLENR